MILGYELDRAASRRITPTRDIGAIAFGIGTLLLPSSVLSAEDPCFIRNSGAANCEPFPRRITDAQHRRRLT
jgi:hypothetical protein